MMNRDEYYNAIRRVEAAEWFDASQGERSGYYAVKLKCDHNLTCLHYMLQSYMFCIACFNASDK